jgi:hypothetical protein
MCRFDDGLTELTPFQWRRKDAVRAAAIRSLQLFKSQGEQEEIDDIATGMDEPETLKREIVCRSRPELVFQKIMQLAEWARCSGGHAHKCVTTGLLLRGLRFERGGNVVPRWVRGADRKPVICRERPDLTFPTVTSASRWVGVGCSDFARLTKAGKPIGGLHFEYA